MRQYRSFEEARAFVHSLALPNSDAWAAYSKSGKRPKDIPAVPRIAYKDEFKGMGDWLGTGNVAQAGQPLKELPMEEIRRLYEEEGVGLRTLAMRYDVGKDTIKRRLADSGVDTSKPDVDPVEQAERKRQRSREWKARQGEDWKKKERKRASRLPKKGRKVFIYDNLSMGTLRDID
jgi:hypothetical protein